MNLDWGAVGFLCAVAMVIVVVILSCVFLDKVACDRAWERSQYEYKWTLIPGCMIKTQEGWIKSDYYRNV